MEKTKTFEEVYTEIIVLTKLHNVSYADHLGKLMEESGEFAQELNKINGTKSPNEEDTLASVRLNVLEEGVDTIQVICSIFSKLNITTAEILDTFSKKNKKYKKKINKPSKILK